MYMVCNANLSSQNKKLVVSNRKSCHRRKVEREETFSVKSGLDVRNNGSDQFQISIEKFLNGQKLAWICLSFTRDPRKRASF